MGLGAVGCGRGPKRDSWRGRTSARALPPARRRVMLTHSQRPATPRRPRRLTLPVYLPSAQPLAAGFSLPTIPNHPAIAVPPAPSPGGIYEYTVENASASDVPSLEKRTAKLERAVVARAEELRRAALRNDFEPPPSEAVTGLGGGGEGSGGPGGRWAGRGMA